MRFAVDTDPDFDVLPQPVQTRPVRRIRNGSPQQEAFWAELLAGDDHLLLEARAGTGKSSSCREGMWRQLLHDPDRVIRYCCFNKKIADEFAADCPPGVDVGTMHRFGLQACREAYPACKVEAQKTYTVLDSIGGGKDLKRYVRKSIATIVSLAKNHGLRPDQEDLDRQLMDLVVHYDVETWRRDGEVLEFACEVLERSAETTGLVDFDDMLWLPALHELRFPGCDDLFIDECLPSWIPVHLADGTHKSIGEIVDNKLPVEVLAYDTTTGTQRACRVTGWSRTPNRKPLVKVKVRWNRKKGSVRPTNFVVCTTDHKIWADGCWTQAGDLRPGMTVQVETAAAKAQRGKITTHGRRALSAAISTRNASGAMGAPPSHGRPPVRGGNGMGPTLAESELHAALGPGWRMQHVVKTGLRHLGYPHCYKIDLANTDAMIAVEVDGQSHRTPARRASDRRKDEFLRSKGWKVIRVTNREAIQETDACAARIRSSDCPIGATVVSVEPVSIPDNFVYDITVEGCHNFYANGILVHNCQDLNPLQHELAERLSHAGRCIIVGDPYQAIYGWRGADTDSIPKLRDRLGARMLYLTVTWRCPRSHVELARQLVPDFEAAPEAPEGTLRTGTRELIDRSEPGDMVLCRANAPIVSACLQQIGRRMPAVVRGRAIGEDLLRVVARVEKEGLTPTIPVFVRNLASWRAREVMRLEAKDGTEHLVEQVTDQAACLDAVASSCQSPTEIPGVIRQLFSDDDSSSRVTFSSVHRAKGSEARRVTYLQIPYSEQRDRVRRPAQWEFDQRRNLRYVAITRSLDTLNLVV